MEDAELAARWPRPGSRSPYVWQDMVTISLDDTGKAALRQRITTAATALTPGEQP
jgi:hypothetical protein